MKTDITANDVLMFFLEMAVYVAVAAGAVKLTSGLPLRVVAAVAAVLVMAVPWGIFASPKASMPLHGAARIAFECGWFGLGAVALWVAGWPIGALVLAGLSLINGVLRWTQ